MGQRYRMRRGRDEDATDWDENATVCYGAQGAGGCGGCSNRRARGERRGGAGGAGEYRVYGVWHGGMVAHVCG